jgi:RNA polymerase sigma factor (sigma-70 family)
MPDPPCLDPRQSDLRGLPSPCDSLRSPLRELPRQSERMSERQRLEALFLEHLPVIDRIIEGIARRNACTGDGADDFGAWVKLRIIENDYAMLAKFRGESSLPTYLTVCIVMLYKEYRVAERGRWRPSAGARREGPVAVRLEMLIYRDGFTLSQAGNIIRSESQTTLTDGGLGVLLRKLRIRTPLRPVQTGTPSVEPLADTRADDAVRGQEQAVERRAAQLALVDALDVLPPHDRILVRMHYLEDMSVAEVARALSVEQKPLYRRLDRALLALRANLERAGFSRDRIQDLTADPP